MLYTEKIIEGTKFENILPQGISLVLEGGGTRGFFTAGVFDAFIEEGIMFPYIVGVSAGAANALSYISGQKGRNKVVLMKYVNNHRYVSRRNLLKHRSLFGFDFIFETVPNKFLYFDWESFKKTNIRFLTGVMDCATGKTKWFEKDQITKGFAIVRASCSIPLMAKIVKHKGLELLDGGISDPIPIEKSIEDGNKFHVIILTRNRGYKKGVFRQGWLMKLIYRKHPALYKVMRDRHNTYNEQVALCEQLEREGKALIIRPKRPNDLETTSRDIIKLLRLYDEGYVEGKFAANEIKIIAPDS